MADGKGESRAGLANGGRLSPVPSACRLTDTLRALEDGLREDGVSAFTSSAYCRRFCEMLLQHTEDNTASESLMHCADVYETALRSFASARPYLTTECEDVLLLLERLVLSCFEVVLSMSEDDLSSDQGEHMKKSIIDSHEMLVDFGNKHLQLLVDNISHGGAWRNPVLVKILSRQSVDPEEVNYWILQEGLNFLQLRIKHLMKTNCIQQAMLLSKICSDSEETSSDTFFHQSYITCLCTMLPDDEAFKEISKMAGQDVLDAICNLESEGQINTAFILCTTYLTQQLQNEVASCSWELTLFWSKLQRRIDPCLSTFLERCRQFGVIAKTRQHLFFLIKVVHTEAGDEGVPVSIMLCIRALQITSNENDATKTSVCKTIACLLPQDLEVRRACQLTEFLFEPTTEGLNILEELYLQPDQKNVEESSVISNSLRCELLLALKSHWLFDPEFWDWKTLKRHCLKLLGQDGSDTEEESYGEPSVNDPDLLDASLASYNYHAEQTEETQEYTFNETENVKVKKPVGSSERYKRWLQYKFYCVICNREVIEARILHHAKMHLEDGIYTCPVCVKKFRKKEIFVPHVMDHMKMPMRHRQKKKETKKRESTKSPEPEPEPEPESDPDGYMSFRALRDKNLQDRDVYPCPGTDCSRVFKQFKYLSIHLKAEHQNNDENAKHYLDLKNMREKCGYCRRHFITNFHLSQHMRIHVGSHPFMCVSIDCNERFKTVNELLHHKHTHLELQYKCELEGCHLVFSDLGLLYHHEAQHFRDAAYTCTFPQCKKFYYCKTELQKHIATHVAHSENSFGNGTEFFNNLKNEVGNPNNSSCNYPPSLIERNIMSSKETEPESENLEEEKLEQVKTEPYLHHGMGPDCTLKNECKDQINTEKLNMNTCKMSDPASDVKQECLHSSGIEELLEKPHEAESLCNVTMPNEAHIKSEEEEIPTSEDFTKSSTSEDVMFELLTSLKQLNLKNVDSCIQETIADSSKSSKVTQNRNTKKKEKVPSQYISQLSSKPFFCEFKGCKSAFVTKAALLLHYCKKHDYTKEKALKLNMFQKKFSPFECHICQRRFTRRTLLRFHYKTDHHIGKEKPRRNVRKFDKKMKPRIKHQRRTGCWEKLLTNEVSCQSNVRTSPVQEGFISETYADSLSDETDSSNAFGALRPDDLTSIEARGARRIVDKDKSCYALNKYHKPFHCIHKSCNASFTSQRGLVRHYQLVHQYNRESLCLEKDKAQNKETNKCRRIFTCKYEECKKSFICGRALSKHYKEFHDLSENEEKEVDGFDNENYLQSETEEDEVKFSDESESEASEIYCDEEGCTAVFTDHTNYSRHVMTRHRKYDLYDCRRKRKKKVKEVDENYIEPKRHKRFFQRKNVKVQNNAGNKEEVEFKTRKEALQMCAQNTDTTQFPCMVHGCSSVVKLESSIIRHYKLTHHLNPAFVSNQIRELVYCVKNLSKNREEFSSPEGSPKSSDHLQDSKITRLSLRSNNIGTSNERGDSYKTSNSDLRKNGSVDRDFYGTSPHHNKITNNVNESDMKSSNRRNEDRTSKSSGKENVSSFHKGHKEENYKGVPSQDPGESDLLDSTKCNQQDPVQAVIGLTNFKPMGFESSFLKFLQESRNSDEDDESDSDEWDFPQKSKRRHSLQNRKRACKERNEREIRLSLGKTASSEPTLENLRTMLDKALTDCGDLALKQLHQLYQKPVVVLERSDFTAPLIDLFSSKKTDQLCVGIS
ncbi:zinc finger protein Rlf [Lithobates pipiens]